MPHEAEAEDVDEADATTKPQKAETCKRPQSGRLVCGLLILSVHSLGDSLYFSLALSVTLPLAQFNWLSCRVLQTSLLSRSYFVSFLRLTFITLGRNFVIGFSLASM